MLSSVLVIWELRQIGQKGTNQVNIRACYYLVLYSARLLLFMWRQKFNFIETIGALCTVIFGGRCVIQCSFDHRGVKQIVDRCGIFINCCQCRCYFGAMILLNVDITRKIDQLSSICTSNLPFFSQFTVFSQFSFFSI